MASSSAGPLNIYRNDYEIELQMRQIQQEKRDCLTQGHISILPERVHLDLQQNDFTEMVGIWEQWRRAHRDNFQNKYGHIAWLLYVPVDDQMLRAIVQFWDPSYRCFVFNKVDMTPTIEEYFSLLLIDHMQPDKIYWRAQKTGHRRKLAKLLGMTTGAISYAPIMVRRQFGSEQFVPMTHQLDQLEFTYGEPETLKRIEEIVQDWKKTCRVDQGRVTDEVTTGYHTWHDQRVKNVIHPPKNPSKHPVNPEPQDVLLENELTRKRLEKEMMNMKRRHEDELEEVKKETARKVLVALKERDEWQSKFEEVSVANSSLLARIQELQSANNALQHEVRRQGQTIQELKNDCDMLKTAMEGYKAQARVMANKTEELRREILPKDELSERLINHLKMVRDQYDKVDKGKKAAGSSGTPEDVQQTETNTDPVYPPGFTPPPARNASIPMPSVGQYPFFGMPIGPPPTYAQQRPIGGASPSDPISVPDLDDPKEQEKLKWVNAIEREVYVKRNIREVETSMEKVFEALVKADMLEVWPECPNVKDSRDIQRLCCLYHKGCVGHSIQDCSSFRKEVQRMMDESKIEFYTEASESAVNMISKESTHPMKIKPLTIFYESKGEFVEDKNRAKMIIEVPKPFPYKDNKAVPWNYNCNVQVSEAKKWIAESQDDAANITGGGGITRSGRCYSPEAFENLKNEKGKEKEQSPREEKILGKGYRAGAGLGKELQGIRSPIRTTKNEERFGLGYKTTKKEREEMIAERRKERLARFKGHELEIQGMTYPHLYKTFRSGGCIFPESLTVGNQESVSALGGTFSDLSICATAEGEEQPGNVDEIPTTYLGPPNLKLSNWTTMSLPVTCDSISK
ncbi:Uncharacterized protein TCM_042889 [Theobroma cacao]|uniref:G-patch domain-containing protein n=1 Tax=Theobroma cacao TaxID=3641 RepID=A0A061FU58_THECC|nr:Uncharacterized protein TCM_042889 [Theobroma cacao]